MSTELITHTEKLVRNADGKISELREHSWPEPAFEHAKHRSTNAQTLRAQERVTAERNGLRTQVAEFRGRVSEFQEQLAEVRTETLRREQVIRADFEAKLNIAQARKHIPSPVGMIAPEPGQLAVDYLASLADLELQLAEIARLEGRSAPVREYWVLPPGTDAAPASEATS